MVCERTTGQPRRAGSTQIAFTKRPSSAPDAGRAAFGSHIAPGDSFVSGRPYREVALNALVRAVVTEWLGQRTKLDVPASERALFVSRKGTRLSPRAADAAARRVASDAGLKLSAHVLRHTCLTNLVRQGEDLVMVAEIAGHVRIETTRRYSLPSKADRQAAMERMDVDY